jgi:Lon protease-like protein
MPCYSRRASSAWCSRSRKTPTTTSIPLRARRCSASAARGASPSFQENEEGRYLITLSGLIRFAIKRELPLHENGFRMVEPDFAPFAEDMAEKDFEMAAKAEFLAAFKAYVEKKQLKVDWEAIKGAPDDHLLVSLAMLSPFSPEEKQSLLECADLAQLSAMMTALFELAVANRQSPDRILH